LVNIPLNTHGSAADTTNDTTGSAADAAGGEAPVDEDASVAAELPETPIEEKKIGDAMASDTGLESLIDQTISVITNDGRNIMGVLRGFDQATNLILDESHERVYSTKAGIEQVVLGLHIIRGDNIGEVAPDVEEAEAPPALVEEATPPEEEAAAAPIESKASPAEEEKEVDAPLEEEKAAVVALEVEPEAPAAASEEPALEEEAAPVKDKHPTHCKRTLLQFPPGPHRVHRWAHTRTPHRLHLTHLCPQSPQLRASHKLRPPMQQLPLPWIWIPQPPPKP
jgi:U6 snRNA-associated Sm-like protein LSm8